MFKSFQQEAEIELIDPKEYTLLKENEEEIYFRTGKTKTNKYIVIQAQYDNNNKSDFYQTKLTLNNLREKSQKFKDEAKSIDDSFLIIINEFEEKKVYVKDINKNYLKLGFQFQEKNLEINLPHKNFENKFFLKRSKTQQEFLNTKKISLNLNDNLQNEEINKIEEIPENKEEEEQNNIEVNNNNIIINEKNEDENSNNIINEPNTDTDNIINNNNNEDEKNIEKNNIENSNEEKENNIQQNNIEEIHEEQEIELNKEENNNIINIIKDENKEENKIEDNLENNNIIITKEEQNDNNKNNEENNNNINVNINSDNLIINENENKIIEKEESKHDIKNNNEGRNIKEDMNYYIYTEKIKLLEEENRKLKEENIQLKEKLLSEEKLKEEKLKKSEKEKENLKIELQKLKNLLKKHNIHINDIQNHRKISDSEEDRLNKEKEIIEESPRQQTISLTSRMELFQTEEKPKKNKKNEKEENNIIIEKNKNGKNTKEKWEENNQNKINFVSKSPINLKIYKTLTQSCHIIYSLDNTFAAFTSLKNELLLVYATKFNSIEFFDLVKQKYHKTILNAHNGQILTIRHYCPRNFKKDMLLSGSNGDYSVKIWEVENGSCICNINKIYQKGNMYSVCILFDIYQKESYIYTSSDCDYIKIFDINGKFKKNINKTNNETYFIDTYYDKKDFKYYLISGDMKCVKSYDVNTDQLFRTYIDSNSFSEHVSVFIYNNSGIVKLVESEFYGSIRIWNFHNGNLIKKIDVCRRIPLVSLCLWNEDYLLVSCTDCTIKLVDFKNYALIKSFEGHNNEVCTIKKIVHPNFGECLLSQGLGNDQIKMWTNI